MSNDEKIIKMPVIRSKMLGVNVFRGFAELSTLSEISQADIYDQQNNPLGTQRDLSEKHAKDAYTYIKTKEFGFWPEVFLCARNNKILTYTPISDEHLDLGILTLNFNLLTSMDETAISRIDGNHRLYYADGKTKGFSKVQKNVSFCLAYDLSREEEIQLFKDINKNQKPMNTSHLDRIEVRLTPEQELKKLNPDLYIAQKLGGDTKSPFYQRIYEGGKKPAGVDIPLRGIRTGIQYMLSSTTKLITLPDVDAQYVVIRNYFAAVKKWQPKAWTSPKDFIMLRGAGLWAICFLGAFVIDRALINQKFKTQDLLNILSSGKDWDWSKKGDFVGLSGRGGALEISKRISTLLKDDENISTDELFRQIMSDS